MQAGKLACYNSSPIALNRASKASTFGITCRSSSFFSLLLRTYSERDGVRWLTPARPRAALGVDGRSTGCGALGCETVLRAVDDGCRPDDGRGGGGISVRTTSPVRSREEEEEEERCRASGGRRLGRGVSTAADCVLLWPEVD